MSDLLEVTKDLVDIASPSRSETAIADLVEARLSKIAHLSVTRIEDNVVATSSLGRAQRMLLGGHLDTVPPASGNERARRDGDVLYGCGSADMKGGIAVMLSLAERVRAPQVDVTYLFYACEEIARRFSGLHAIERDRPDLLRADAAILLEPTSARIEAGCQGVLRVAIEIHGERAHSARPWAGVNAIHRVGHVLDLVRAFDEREPVIEGCRYHETLQAVQIEGGGIGNVVPDHARVVLSHRFAPDRSAEEALEQLGAYLAPALDQSRGDTITLEEAAPAARPQLDQPLIAELARLSGQAPVAKIAWTDVAYFAERDVPAANYGPGDPMLAHRSDEHLEREPLERVHRTLERLLSGG
jgi:succinyl-diaminopimelate desuccinylase